MVEPRKTVLQRKPKIELYRGDCLTVLRSMRSESVDAVVADPPHGIGYLSKRSNGPAIVNDERPFVWWLYDAYRVLKPGTALVCFCRWDVREVFKTAIEVAGFKVRSQWVWDRKVHGMGDCKATLAPRHDLMWFATKVKFAFPSGRPKSVIASGAIRGPRMMHPTQKPVDLLANIVRWVTPKGGTVLDPCMGSGSTGEACVQKGFGFVGIGIDGGYHKVAVGRMRRAIGDKRKAA